MATKSAKVMGKQEMVEALASRMECSKKDAGDMISSFIDIITETLAKGDSVRLIPFGTFEVRQRKSRTGRNPQTGETIEIAARKVPAFKAGKALRETVN